MAVGDIRVTCIFFGLGFLTQLNYHIFRVNVIFSFSFFLHGRVISFSSCMKGFMTVGDIQVTHVLFGSGIPI